MPRYQQPAIGAIPWKTDLDYDNQASEVPGTRKPGQTGHYRNNAWPFLDLDRPGALTTLTQCFEAGYAKGNDGDRLFTGYRPILSTNPLTFASQFVWKTYREVDEIRQKVGSALEKLFREGVVGGGEYQTVGIWSQNRPEWQYIDLAIQAYRKVSVALYDTLGSDSVEYIIQHAHLSIIFATSQHLPTLMSLAAKLPVIKVIVSIDPLAADTKRVLQHWGKEKGVQIMEFSEVELLGEANHIALIPATPHQIASICYTSGTTNTPKGVVLTHAMLASSAHACIHGAFFQEKGGKLLSYLPLAHIYERICELLVISLGGQIGYFSGDPLRLLEDAQILQPTYFPSVPRVLNRVYQAAMLAGNVPTFRGNIFRKAVEVKLQKLRETGENTHLFWDKLVFRKVQAALGGRIETLTSGSAPIAPDALDFLKIAFACEVVEGYGMTENCGTCTRCWTKDPSCTGLVGPPQPNCEIKLVDVPAMNYSATDLPHARGEVCVRGAGCFNTYYKDPQNTAETVDSEGWVHTGDIGEIDTKGRLKIIDRIKNIMKLAQGEYVALEKIENLYSATAVVEQIYVHGDSLQDHLVAVVVPEATQLAKITTQVLGKELAPADAIKDSQVASAILRALTAEARKAGLKGFEMVRRVHLTLDPFSVEDGTMTPTFKLRRKDAYKKHQLALDALYTSNAAVSQKL